MKQHRSFRTFALTLSTQFALVCAAITATSAASAESVAVNGGITLTAGTYTVAENAGSVTITAERGGGKTGALSVSYTTANGTALAGKQFTAKTGTLTWANGDTSNKTFTIAISDATPTTTTKWFAVRLTAEDGTLLGYHGSATIDIVGAAQTTAATSKSIRQWVSCSDDIDESAQLQAALTAAANNAFTLVIDCAVRLHTGSAASHSIPILSGTTVQFESGGEFLIGANSIPALTIANLSEVTLLNWNIVDL
jgi:Calx-beta domain